MAIMNAKQTKHATLCKAVIISYDSPRGGVSVITEKGDTTTSFLLIQNARPSDSGQYTCNPSNAKSKSVTVHVLNETRFRLRVRRGIVAELHTNLGTFCLENSSLSRGLLKALGSQGKPLPREESNEPATVLGEYPAAMQRAGQPHHRAPLNHPLLVLVSALVSSLLCSIECIFMN
uniref:Ig-like domain-containing protein n=1 Tax=Anopheles coluzzii TaxID=1518534 RepID=A0A8W7Q226_ANOCL